MHDWTLIDISFTWSSGEAVLRVRNGASDIVSVRAIGVTNLVVPRLQDWGRSSSINELTGPEDIESRKRLRLEIQSGDVIEILASDFHLPPL